MCSHNHSVRRSVNVGVTDGLDPPARKPTLLHSLWRRLCALLAKAPGADSRRILGDYYIDEARSGRRVPPQAERSGDHSDENGHRMDVDRYGPPVMRKGVRPWRVNEIMRPPRVTVNPQLSVQRLKAMFERYDAGTLPVIDEHGVLRGVVDVLDLFEIARPPSNQWMPDVRALWARRVEDIMSRGAMTIGPGEPVDSAVQLMVDYQLESLPVVVGPRRAPLLVGTVSARDLLVCIILERGEGDSRRTRP